jgi:hypothetical protein
VIHESALVVIEDSRAAGRPLSPRSAWALIAVCEGRQQSVMDAWATTRLVPAEWSRARRRATRLAAQTPDPPCSEDTVRSVASALRSLLRKRAERRLHRASPRDLADLRADGRLLPSGLSDARCGIAAGDLVEGYVATEDLDTVVDDYLLSPATADPEPNVVLHVTSAVYPTRLTPAAGLLMAADLAEHRRPREEARAIELLRDVLRRRPSPTEG